ncbi:hypothetical protein ACWDA7_48325 [Streptomyces sp. NPDC001156]
MFVLVEDAAQAFTPSYVEAGDLPWIEDRPRQGVLRLAIRDVGEPDRPVPARQVRMGPPGARRPALSSAVIVQLMHIGAEAQFEGCVLASSGDRSAKRPQARCGEIVSRPGRGRHRNRLRRLSSSMVRAASPWPFFATTRDRARAIGGNGAAGTSE